MIQHGPIKPLVVNVNEVGDFLALVGDFLAIGGAFSFAEWRALLPHERALVLYTYDLLHGVRVAPTSRQDALREAAREVLGEVG